MKSRGEETNKIVLEVKTSPKNKINVENSMVSNRKPEVFKKDISKNKHQLSKSLINEMMNKISLKSVSEENYPASNETAERLMLELDHELKYLEQ